MITHLISTTDFVKLVDSSYKTLQSLDIDLFQISLNYANFISQKPTLSMFVPCDKEGNVLEEYDKDDDSYYGHLLEEEYFEKRRQAESKVLFKGWYKEENCITNGEQKIQFPVNENTTLESLLQYWSWMDNEVFELTETALNQIGLCVNG